MPDLEPRHRNRGMGGRILQDTKNTGAGCQVPGVGCQVLLSDYFTYHFIVKTAFLSVSPDWPDLGTFASTIHN